MNKRILNSEFRCPKCGGFSWGTSHADEAFSKWVGQCNSGGCPFTWMRSRDDWRVFVFTIRPTRAEYAKLHTLDMRERNRRNRESTLTKGSAR